MANEEIKVIADKEDIVAIADKVRTLDGVSSAYTINGIANSVEVANSEIDIQAAKIAELSTILDSKAASGGSSAELKVVTGVFTPSETTSNIVVEHNLGVIPKIIHIAGISTDYIMGVIGSREPGVNYQCFIAALYAAGNSYMSHGGSFGSTLYVYNETGTNVDIISNTTNEYGICGVTETSLTLSLNTNIKLYTGIEYKYIIAG